jgi:hypothetical protein
MNHDIVVVGAGFAGRGVAARLRRAGLTDFVVLTKAAGYMFDEATDRWTIHTTRGEVLTARIVVLTEAPLPHLDITGRDGLTIREAWQDGTTTYLGVVVAGFPNLFLVLGPNSGGGSQRPTLMTKAQLRYVIACIRMMGRADARGIEVHQHAQDRFNRWVRDSKSTNRPESSLSYWRRMRRPDPRHFRLTPFEDDIDETHRGPAVVTTDGTEIDVQVHLTGHLQPIDGSYRWFGRIARHPEVTALHQAGRKEITVRLPGGEAAKAKLTELDPWGNVRVTGTGRPPFPTD